MLTKRETENEMRVRGKWVRGERSIRVKDRKRGMLGVMGG